MSDLPCARDAHPSDLGKVYYLTIQESEVQPGRAQRRPGLHVDTPASVNIRDEDGAGGAEAGGAGSSHKYKGDKGTRGGS